MPSAHETILEYGDCLEREMFADNEFACLFQAYPIIWRALVLPNRDPEFPTLGTGIWQRFAEHHYSAIVRCWNARSARARIDWVCTAVLDYPQDFKLYLDLQEHYVSFFCCIGGVKDNLQAVFNDPVVDAAAAFDRQCGDPLRTRNLRWFYERRTQAVHKIVVPFFDIDGLPHFDLASFADPDARWETRNKTDVRCISTEVSQIWDDFQYVVAGCWSNLVDIVCERHPAAFQDLSDEHGFIMLPPGSGSGAPPPPEGFIPPSGSCIG